MDITSYICLLKWLCFVCVITLNSLARPRWVILSLHRPTYWPLCFAWLHASSISPLHTTFIPRNTVGIMFNLRHHQSARLSVFVEFIHPKAHYWIWLQNISGLIPLALQSPFRMICLSLYYLSLLLLGFRTVWPSSVQQTKAPLAPS